MAEDVTVDVMLVVAEVVTDDVALVVAVVVGVKVCSYKSEWIRAFAYGVLRQNDSQ